MKLPTISSPLKLFSPAPAQPAFGLAGAGNTMMFASGGGGGDDYPDDFDQYDDFDDQPEEPRRRPRATRSSGAGGRDASGGRPRTSQFQPEERFWTDYLRIALPVVGLLLLIGLLWFWADRLINDEPGTTEPVPTQNIGQVLTSTPTPPVATEPVNTPPPADTNTAAGETQTTPPAQTEPGGDNQSGQSGQAATSEPEPTEPPADTGGKFYDGETVEVTEALNLRPNPSTDGAPVAELAAGDLLTITGGPEQGESYTWWEVLTADGSTSGWVVEDYIKAAE